ncbi:MAG: ATP synthase subunit I [Gammaproteobacteria bacterium]|jgi:F1F0 ATPase subunit 2
MNDWAALLIPFLLGMLLGALYLAGLWITVRRLPRVRRPARWLLASTALRIGLLLAGFWYLLGDGHWPRLLAALAGFVTLRTLTLGRVRRSGEAPRRGGARST